MSHPYVPIQTLTLTLPTLAGDYEALQQYRCRCGCGRWLLYDLHVSNRRPLPSLATLQAYERWAKDHPTQAAKQRMP